MTLDVDETRGRGAGSRPACDDFGDGYHREGLERLVASHERGGRT